MYIELATLAFGCYVLYNFTSAIHTIWFHPLRYMPGPKLWIAFPIFRYISTLRGNFDQDIRVFHATYGEAVRYGPKDVSFTTSSAWNDIYGYGQAKLPKVIQSTADTSDILNANDMDHRRIRRALSHAFSTAGLQSALPTLVLYVNKLVERLEEVIESGKSTDMVKWYNFTTFDIMGDLAFGQSFGCLDNSSYHNWIATLFQSVKLVSFIHFKDNYPLLFLLLSMMIPKSLIEAQKEQDEYTKITVQKRFNLENSRADFMEYMMRARGTKNELSDHEMEANAKILVLAGSETAATLLSGATYWLLQNRNALDRVTQEVRSNLVKKSDITVDNVTSRLPYLLACINEAFRLYPPVPTGTARIALSQMSISGYIVPPGTKAFVHQSSSYWSERNFYQPEHYIPERWLVEAKSDPASPFYNDDRDVVQPFTVGPRSCIGKHLTYMEVCLILAHILWKFDLELCDESRDWHIQKTWTLWEKGPLTCRLHLRDLEVPETN